MIAGSYYRNVGACRGSDRQRLQARTSDSTVYPEHLIDWEFSEALRSPRLSSGWFLLPSAALSLLILWAIL